MAVTTLVQDSLRITKKWVGEPPFAEGYEQ